MNAITSCRETQEKKKTIVGCDRRREKEEKNGLHSVCVCEYVCLNGREDKMRGPAQWGMRTYNLRTHNSLCCFFHRLLVDTRSNMTWFYSSFLSVTSTNVERVCTLHRSSSRIFSQRFFPLYLSLSLSLWDFFSRSYVCGLFLFSSVISACSFFCSISFHCHFAFKRLCNADFHKSVHCTQFGVCARPRSHIYKFTAFTELNIDRTHAYKCVQMDR